MWSPDAGRDHFGVNLISSLKLKMTGPLPPCLLPSQCLPCACLVPACLARGRADGAWYVNRQVQGSLAQPISPRSKQTVKTQFMLVCTHQQRRQSQRKFSGLLKVYLLQQEVCKARQQLCEIFTQPTPQGHNMINATLGSSYNAKN